MPTVMVVDDEPAVRDLTARILRSAGYATVQLTDGHEAWNYLQRSGLAVDAIISDVVMPRVTGTELVALVREAHPTLPVVLMSAYNAAELRARGLEDCPVPLLTKPFGHDQLVTLVKSLLGSGSPR